MQNLSRDLKIDNMRGIGIFLTVMAHFLALNVTTFNWFINVTIYFFHMPLLAWVSGVSENFSKRSRLERIISMFIYYVMAQIAFKVLWADKLSWISFFSSPYGINWFLLSLLCWQVLSVLLSRFIKSPKVQMLLIAILWISIGFWNFDLTNYSLGRTVYFYPFYFAGEMSGTYKGNQKKHGVATSAHRKWYIIVIIFIFELLLFINLEQVDRTWTFGTLSYGDTGYTLLIRCITAVVATMFIYVLFKISSKKRTFFTTLGEKSITIYFGHGLIYLWMIYEEFTFSMFPGESVTLFVILFTYLVSYVFSRNSIHKIISSYLSCFSIARFIRKYMNNLALIKK